MNAEIRFANADDAKALLEIEQASFEHPWSIILFETDLEKNPHAKYWLACENDVDGKVVGFIGTHNMAGEINITNVAVHPDYRKQGTADMLMNSMLEYFDAEPNEGITLEVDCENEPAIKLYEKYGFVTEGRRKGYYQNGHDALIMWRRKSNHIRDIMVGL